MLKVWQSWQIVGCVKLPCKLMDTFRATGLNSSELAQLINALGRLGCSPFDRSKVSIMPQPKTKDNDFAEVLEPPAATYKHKATDAT